MNYVEIIDNYSIDNNIINDLNDFINYCLDKLKLNNVMFNVIIVNNDNIQNINNEYRSINKPTDVITFALEDNKQINTPGVRVLGDIYISYDKVISQANEYNHSIKREISFLAIHGILHLLGYDHMNSSDEKIMFDLQKEMLNCYGIKKES